MWKLHAPAILVLCLSACGPTEQPVDMTQQRAAAAAAPASLGRKPGQTLNWLFYNWLKCDASWNQICKGKVYGNPPDGWRICKPTWGHVSAGKGGPLWAVKLINLSTVEYSMFVSGSQQAWDKWGSNLQVDNVGASIIPDNASPAERAAAGCVDPGWIYKSN